MLYLPRYDKEISDALSQWRDIFQHSDLHGFTLGISVAHLAGSPGYILNHIFDWDETLPQLDERRHYFSRVVRGIVTNGNPPMSALRRYRQYITSEKQHGG